MKLKLSFDIDASEIEALADKLRNDCKSAYPLMLAKAEELLTRSIEGRLYGSLMGWERSVRGIVGAFTGNVDGNGFELYMDASKMPMIPGTYAYNEVILGIYGGMSGQDFRQPLLEGLDVGGISPSPYNKRGLPATGYFKSFIAEVEEPLVKVLRDHLASLGWNVS